MMRRVGIDDGRGFLLLTILLVTTPLHAGSDENIDRLIDRKPVRRAATWLETEVLDPALAPLSDLQAHLKEEHHLDIGAAWSLFLQAASGSHDDDELAASNFDVFGRWRPIEGGALGFQVRDRRNLNEVSSADFAAAIDSLWRTTDTQTEGAFTALIQLWWQQRLLDGRVVVTAGKIDQSSYFNSNRFADSDDTMFMSRPLASNPTRAFPGNGLGVAVVVTPDDHWYFGVGAGDANGSATTSGFNSVGDGDLFKVAEFGWTPQFEELGPGNYRFTINHTDATSGTDENTALSFSADQDLGPHWGAFVRYGTNEREVTSIAQIVAAGVVYRGPFGFEHDVAGLGIIWGDPTSGSRRHQAGVELFYRAQISPSMQLSPGVQFLFNPADSSDGDPVVVFGLRTRIRF